MLNEFEKFGYSITAVVLIIVALIAYPAMKIILKILVKQYNQFSRPGQNNVETSSAPKAAYTRKTDIYEKLSPEQKKIHELAENLLRAGDIKQAAHLFEQINFQRRAIDELEKAGMIDDACAILIRINATSRAAIVYERNGQLEKAAKIFKQVQQFEKAAEIYETLSHKNFFLLEQAAICYNLAGDFKAQINCLAVLGQVVKIVEICRQNNRYDLLITSLGNPIFFESALDILNSTDIERLLEDLPMNPQAVVNFCLWLSLAQPGFVPMSALLKRLEGQESLKTFFWHVACEKIAGEVLSSQNWEGADQFIVSTLEFFSTKSEMKKEFAYIQSLQSMLFPNQEPLVPDDLSDESEEAVVFDLKLAS